MIQTETYQQVIERWLRAEGWTRRRLALHAGIPANYLSAILTGRLRPGRVTMLRLEAAMGLPRLTLVAMLPGPGVAVPTIP